MCFYTVVSGSLQKLRNRLSGNKGVYVGKLEKHRATTDCLRVRFRELHRKLRENDEIDPT